MKMINAGHLRIFLFCISFSVACHSYDTNIFVRYRHASTGAGSLGESLCLDNGTRSDGWFAHVDFL